MPLHSVGYRSWDGKRTSRLTRWWIIATTGIRLSFKSRWVKRLMFFAWLPVLYWTVVFFTLEQSLGTNGQGFFGQRQNIEELANELLDEELDEEELKMFEDMQEKAHESRKNARRKLVAEGLRNRFQMLPKIDELADALEEGDDDTVRNTVWNWLLMTFFRYPQATLILFLLGFVAPGLISRDIRSRAFLLYFSRPIGRFEYVFGKLLIPTFHIVMVTTLPALALYLFAVSLSPDISILSITWDIPLRIIGASIALILPTASLALMLSALTHESRFASFAWFAVWVLGHGAWFAVVVSQTFRLRTHPFDPVLLESAIVQRWSVLSLYNNLGDVQSWIFGFSDFESVWPGALALSMLTLVSLILLFRCVSAPLRT